MTAKKRKIGGPASARLNRAGLVSLTEKQRRFIDEYVVDHNLTKAMERAGYTAGPNSNINVYGSRLLKTPCIKAEIERRETERARRIDVKDDDILMELKRIAYFDVLSMFDPVTKKLRCDPFDLSENERRALVNFDIIVLNKEGDWILKMQPGNKLRALELLGKHRKLFSEKIEHSGAVNVSFTTDYGDADSLKEKESSVEEESE